MKHLGIHKAVRNFLNSVSSVETTDKLAQEVYQKILNHTDVDSDEYKELVRSYHALRGLYKKLFHEKVEQESSFNIIAVN